MSEFMFNHVIIISENVFPKKNTFGRNCHTRICLSY